MIEDKILIWKFNRGDKQALRLIYEKYRDDMFRVATAILLDRSMVEDVVHDVFVSFASRSGSLRISTNLKGFLAISVANRARDCNRKLHFRAGSRNEVPKDVSDIDNEPPQIAIRKELRDLLASAIEQLPEENKEIIVLRLQTQLRFREIAREKGMSVNTILSRYRYGLDKLRTALNGEYER